METRARYIIVGLFALCVLAAGFGFIYWMHTAGGLGPRALYRIRFDGPTAGLQTGSSVQFNGLRVGEVTAVQLDPADPRRVFATIAVARGTPLSADTKVGVDVRGLMGSPAISLRGGDPSAPLLAGSDTAPPLLYADAAASQDLTQSARQALQRLDGILGDNADAFKTTMDNLKTFSDALGRNSNRIDAIMAGLERMTAGSASEKPKRLFDLAPLPAPEKPLKAPQGQFVVAEPTAINALETQRMLARSQDGEISVIGDAQWSDTLPKLIQARLIQSFENAGLGSTVGAAAEKVAATYQLLIDLRSFSIALTPDPVADVAFSAKIVGENGEIVGARLFHATAPAAGLDAPAVAAALNAAFAKAAAELAAWAAATA